MNIYLSPEAIAVGVKAGGESWDCGFSPQLAKAFEDGTRALIQYIVENPRELSHAERKAVYKACSNSPIADNLSHWQEAFNEALRLAFTPPTPDVPEKIVEICDKYFSDDSKSLSSEISVSLDSARAAITEAYEAGMAVSK